MDIWEQGREDNGRDDYSDSHEWEFKSALDFGVEGFGLDQTEDWLDNDDVASHYGQEVADLSGDADRLLVWKIEQHYRLGTLAKCQVAEQPKAKAGQNDHQEADQNLFSKKLWLVDFGIDVHDAAVALEDAHER